MDFLEDTTVVTVVTFAAPILGNSMLTDSWVKECCDSLYSKISAILTFAVPYSERNPDNYLAFEEVFGEGE